jgi:uncharacterized protein
MRIEQILNSYIDLLWRRRWWIVSLMLLLVVIASAGNRFISFSNNYRDFFGGGDPRIEAFDAMQKIYTKSDNVLIVIAPASGDIFTRETLMAVDKLTQESWKLPYAARVDSITNFQNLRADSDELYVDNLVKSAEKLHAADIERIRQIVLHEPLLVNRLVSPDAKFTGLNVTVRLPGKKIEVEAPEVALAARALAKQIQAQYPSLRVYLSGTVIINNAFYEVVRDDLMQLIPAMFCVLIVLLALLTRSIWGTAAIFMVVAVSNAAAMGIGGWIGIKLTPPVAAAAPIIMTLAIADCVHLFSTYTQALGQDMTRIAAMAQSLRSNIKAMTLTTVTTAIGFATMNLTDSPPFHDLGNLVVVGVGIAYLLALSLFPAVVTLLPVRASHRSGAWARAIDKFSDFIVRRHVAAMWATIAFSVVLIAFIPRNELNDEFLKYFDESIQFRRDNDMITKNMTGVYQIEYSIGSGSSGGVHDPEYLRKLDDFAKWYREQPGVWHVDSITDVIRRINKAMHNDDSKYYSLPDDRNAIAQDLLLYEMSLPVGLDINDRINIDKSATRFVVSLHTLSANEMLSIDRRARDWLERNTPVPMHAVGTGPAIIFAKIGADSIYSGIAQEAVALILISLLIVLSTGWIKIGLFSLAPNLLPAAMAFGLWGLTVGQINMAVATVVSVSLGIIVDDTIHFLTKYTHARQVNKMGPTSALKYVYREVGEAVIITSIVLCLGFAVLMLSPFSMNWGMGALTVTTIFFALLCELFLMPGLLLWLEREGAHEVVADISTAA